MQWKSQVFFQEGSVIYICSNVHDLYCLTISALKLARSHYFTTFMSKPSKVGRFKPV